MAQKALDASGCAFQESDMELSTPEVIHHQEQGNVSETLHNSDEEGNMPVPHREDSPDNPTRESMVVKVTQAPGSLPRVTTALRSTSPSSRGDLIVEDPLPVQGTSRARSGHCATQGANPPRAQGSDQAPATDGQNGAQGSPASHGQARHPSKGNRRVNNPSISQGPGRQSSRSDREVSQSQSTSRASCNQLVHARKQKTARRAHSLDAGPPSKKVRVLNDATPDLSMMDSIELHPSEDEQDEFRDGEWEDEYAESYVEETNSYQGSTNSEREDSDSDYSAGENSLDTENRNDISDLFDPCFDKKKKKWYLPSRLDSYVEKNFSEWVDPEAIKATVVDVHPTPEHDRLRVLKLDDEMLDLIPKHLRPVADKEDGNQRRTQHKLLEALGPLLQAWTKVDARKAAGKDLELAGLIEKSVLLIGQSFVMGNFYRRTSMLARVVGKETAMDAVKKNGKYLAANKSSLFGPTFYKALHKRAKGNKPLREIKNQLGVKTHKSKKGRGGPPRQAGHQRPQAQREQQDDRNRGHRSNQPFRKEAPRGRGGAGRGNKKRWVCFPISSTKIRITNRTNTGKLPATKFNPTHKTNTSQCECCSQSNSRTGSYPTLTPYQNLSRKGGQLPSKLEETNVRPLYPRAGPGHKAGVSHNALTNKSTHMAILPADKSNASRNRFPSKERCNCHCKPNSRSVLKPHVLERKERWLLPAYHKSTRSQPVHRVPTLQNGEHTHACPAGTERRLVREDRPQGRLLLPQHSKRTPQIPAVPVARADTGVPDPTLRPGLSPTDIHQNNETGDRPTEENRDAPHDLPGRHPPPQSIQRQHPDGQRHHDLAPTKPRTGDQHSQINSPTHTEGRIPGLFARHECPDAVSVGDEAGRPAKRLQGGQGKEKDNSTRTSSADRKTDSNKAGGSARTATPDAQNQRTAELEPIIRGNNRTDSTMQNRTDVVDRTPTTVERQSTDHSGARHNHNIRCVEGRVGSRNSYGTSPRTLEPTRSSTAHQRARIDGSGLSTQVLHQREEEVPCAPPPGQHHGSSDDNENGNDQVPPAAPNSKTHLGLRITEGDHSYCRTPARSNEHTGRQAEQSLPRLEQLETEEVSFQPTPETPGSLDNGHVHRQTEPSAREIHELEERPECHSDRCLPDTLGSTTGVRVPTILPNRQMPSKSATRPSNGDDHSTDLAESNMVPNTAGHGDPEPDPTTTPDRPANGRARSEPPPSRGTQPILSGLDSFREELTKVGFSKESSSLLLQSWKPGTQSAYNTPWNKWTRWCNSRKTDPFRSSVVDIGNFLAEEFDRGLEYRTLNVYRSAISALHPSVDGTPVGAHPLIKRLMSGVFNGRPPKARYADTWDVNRVLLHCASLGENKDLTLKQTTTKTAMLMALTTACRGSELQKMNPLLMKWNPEEVTITLDKPIKTSKQGKPNYQTSIKRFPLDRKIDAMACLQDYLEATEEFRTSNARKTHLFLSFTAPHNPVQPCTIARWLKTVMTEAGIDTSVYKAHSTRAASTAKARAQGLSVEQIVNRAQWSNAATYYKFYCREVNTDPTPSFEESVLTT